MVTNAATSRLTGSQRTKLARIRKKWDSDLWNRYVKTLNDKRAVLAGCTVDEGLGQHVCNFIETFCRHSKGVYAGQLIRLERWQREDLLMPLFSWIRLDGARRFRMAEVWVGKKNGKTTISAALMNYGLCGDNEPGAEVYVFANDKDQSAIMWNFAADMVEASPALAKEIKVCRSTKSMTKRSDRAAWIRALSADLNKDGPNASFQCVDEMHAFDARGAIRFGKIKYAGVTRRQPLMLVTSTAGDDESGIGYEQYQYSKGVLDGTIESIKHFAYIAEPEKDADPGSEATWRAANPMFGITLPKEGFEEDWQEAKGNPRKIAEFRQLRCNQWVNAANPWLDMGQWGKCGGEIGWAQFAGQRAGAGLDIASTRDMCSLALLFAPDGDEGLHYMRWWCWLPRDGIVDRSRKDNIQYLDLEAQGWLTLTDGNTTDQAFIRKVILELNEQYSVQWHYDPWGADALMTGLHNKEGLNVAKVRQGVASMSAPSKRFDTLVANGQLRHGDNPIATLQASRVTVRSDENENIMPRKSEGMKKAARRFQIDTIVGGVMAVDAVMNAEDVGPSVYEKRGILVL